MVFILNKLAKAMSGMPRDARILIRLPDERLVDLDHVTPGFVSDDNREVPSTSGAGSYGIILVASDPDAASD